MSSEAAPRTDATPLVERFYALARCGDWPAVAAGWRSSPEFARECAHYARPTSGWGFLHQAAYTGSPASALALVGWGADADATGQHGETPADVARRQGHADLAELLARAATARDLWAPPGSPAVLPSSSLWVEARPRVATAPLVVGYGGGLVEIAPGESYWVDSFERTLVGWHGTFSPPLGMDGDSLLAVAPAAG